MTTGVHGAFRDTGNMFRELDSKTQCLPGEKFPKTSNNSYTDTPVKRSGMESRGTKEQLRARMLTVVKAECYSVRRAASR
jgi:hypothetical protein